jgi:hypothetical protein
VPDRAAQIRRMSDARTGRNGRRWALAAALALALTFLWADTPWAQTRGRVIYMATMEPRDGAQQDPGSLPCGRRVPTGSAGREWAWEVVTHLSSGGTIVALEGETVTVEIVGINGDVHSAIPGLVDSFTVRRAQVTGVIFTAIKPGPHPITCTKRTPDMWGALVVVPE